MEKKIDKAFLEKLGFEKIEKYPHDQFVTIRYKKGHILVALTYENDRQVNDDVMIEEVFYEPITAEELEVITPVLGKS